MLSSWAGMLLLLDHPITKATWYPAIKDCTPEAFRHNFDIRDDNGVKRRLGSILSNGKGNFSAILAIEFKPTEPSAAHLQDHRTGNEDLQCDTARYHTD
jgi:hypothetical protein